MTSIGSATSCGWGYPLAREHHIPLRRQLAADLEAGIRDGHIVRGSRLPSSRDLAQRLGVDRGTVSAAFARLRRRGFVSTRSGRRPVVSPLDTRPGSPRTRLPGELENGPDRAEELAEAQLFEALEQAFSRGVSRDDFLDRLRETIDGLPRLGSSEAVPRASLVEPRPGLRAALAAELRSRAGLVAAPFGRFHGLPAGRPVLVRAEVLARIEPPEDLECVPLWLAGGTEERGVIRRRVRAGLVVLLSVSRAVREYASELAARDFDRGVSFVALDPDDRAAVLRAVATARLVLYDRASADRLPPQTAPTLPITLLAGRTIEALTTYFAGLEAEAGSGPPSRCGT